MGKFKVLKKLSKKIGSSKIGKAISRRVAKNPVMKKTIGRVSKVAKFGAKLAGASTLGAVAGGVGLAVGVEKIAERLGVRGGRGFVGSRVNPKYKGGGSVGGKRRSAVPKAIKKWFSKEERKDKAKNKILSQIINKSTAGKLMKARLKPKGGSAGIITKNEALEALRR